MRRTSRPPLLALAALLTFAFQGTAGNWPQWRGPGGDGVSTETNLPVKWDATSGILWKCDLPDRGASTPAIWGDAVFLTAQQGEKLLLLKVRKSDGKLEWTREVGTGTVVRRNGPNRHDQAFHNLHNMASPSPITDGERVVVHFGNGDLAAYDFAGKQLWLHNLQKEHGTYTIWWGHANSPVLWKDLVICVCMQDSLADKQAEPAESYLVAYDKRSGEQKWKTLRMTGSTQEHCDSYTTPLLYRAAGGAEQLIVVGANTVDAYDPASGKQVWVLPDLGGNRTITGPTLGDGLVYATEGMRGPLLAVRLGGSGKLDKDVVAWKLTKSTPDTPCPVLWKDLLFVVADDGNVQCLDAKTGELKWKERLSGDYKASPLAADGKIYVLSLSGRCTVLAAAPKYEVLAVNEVDDDTIASLAVSDGRIYLRGKKSLYCIGTK